MSEHEDVTFTVTCTMHLRWAKQFLGMLEHMHYLGSVGSSRDVTFFSDGDGDYRPKFLANINLEPALPLETDRSGNTFFDAG